MLFIFDSLQPVTVLSNYLGIEPLHNVRRYEKKVKAMVTVDQPDCIHHYNKRMGGVDLFDNAMANYRISVRGKKWYWPLFTNGLDAAMVNAWKLHCVLVKKELPLRDGRRLISDKVMPQLKFRVSVLNELIDTESVLAPRGPMQKDSPAQKKLRFDQVGHNVTKRNNRIRCRCCGSHTVYFCSKCNVALHAKCFNDYHLGNKTNNIAA